MEIDNVFIHKTLKDTVRRDIIRHLKDRSLTYMELMTLTKITNTGKLNYHLKVLGNLIEKTENGRYKLTAQGQHAVQMLENFPPDNVVQNSSQPTIAKFYKRKNFGLFSLVTSLLTTGTIMLLFGILFLKSPYPYGDISVASLTIIVLGACLLVSGVFIHSKYVREHISAINPQQP
jgi:hypothetical protein